MPTFDHSLSSRLLSIQVGLPRDCGGDDAPDFAQGVWTSGIFKSAVDRPIFLGNLNLDGDGQADLVNHGGLDRALLAYSADHYPHWAAELHRNDLPFGWFGENLTIAGFDEQTVCIGDLFAIGDVRVQVSQPRQPCWKLARRTGVKDLPARVIDTARGGWYLRVLETGILESGMSVILLDRPHADWPVARAFRVGVLDRRDRVANLALSTLPELSADWRRSTADRAARN